MYTRTFLSIFTAKDNKRLFHFCNYIQATNLFILFTSRNISFAVKDDRRRQRVSLYSFRFQCRMAVCFARGSKVATLPAARHHAYSKVAARKADILFSNAPFVLLMVYPAGCRRHSCPRRVTSTLPFPSPFAYPAVLCCCCTVSPSIAIAPR